MRRLERAQSIELTPIGWIRSSRAEPAERAHGWDEEAAKIDLDTDQFDESALLGLETFSHVEVVFVLTSCDRSKLNSGPATRPTARTGR